MRTLPQPAAVHAGQVRDLDVQLGRLEAWISDAAPEDREPLEALRTVLEAQARFVALAPGAFDVDVVFEVVALGVGVAELVDLVVEF